MNEQIDSSRRITLRTLVAARWVLIAIGAGLGVIVSPLIHLPGLDLLQGSNRVIGWCAVIAAWIFFNIIAMRSMSWAMRSDQRAALHLGIDALVLTALFALSGGAANPFTVLYFVPIVLATQISPRWTWGIAILCVAFFGLLFVFASTGHGSQGHHFAGHLRGMWLAFAVSGVVMTYFVHRIAIAIEDSRRQLSTLKESAELDRQLGRLGSLAAGAAHQLGTPLATMAVLVGDLESMSGDERSEAVASIRAEVFRCKEIIASMSNVEHRASRLSTADVEAWSADEVADAFESVVKLAIESPIPRLSIPRVLISEILSELVNNATRANDTTEVGLTILSEGDQVVFVVDDDGAGMSATDLMQATNPFYTTGESEGHMGLGLFLAETQARRLGGSLTIESSLDAGTRARLSVPSQSCD